MDFKSKDLKIPFEFRGLITWGKALGCNHINVSN